ncbi:MAG: lysozyme inhibitor LprI family protein [Rhizobiaceae bacterium]
MRYFILFGAMVFAFGPTHAQEINCAKRRMIAANTVLYCAEKDFEDADRELNFVWRSINKLTRAQKDYSFAILESQRAWIKFRDAQCNAQILYYEEYRKRDQQYVICRTRLTKARSLELKRFVEGG